MIAAVWNMATSPIYYKDKIIYSSILGICLISSLFHVLLSDSHKKNLFRQTVINIFSKIMYKDILIDYNGVKFFARKKKQDALLLNEFSEPWMKSVFKPSEGAIVIDVGSHVGKYALSAASLIGASGRVVAIEPEVSNYDQLLTNISINGFTNIIALNVAAFSDDGYKKFFISSLDVAHHICNLENDLSCKDIVKTRSLDSICQEYNLEKIDFIKIDVEGNEVDVLKGMKNILKNSQVTNVIIEISNDNEHEIEEALKEFNKRDLGAAADYIHYCLFQRISDTF